MDNNNQTIYQQPPYHPPQQPEHGLAIASFVLGIVSVVFSLISTVIGILWFIALACGIVGCVLSLKANSVGNTSGLRNAGFILSIIGTAICVFSVLVILSAFACTAASSCYY